MGLATVVIAGVLWFRGPLNRLQRWNRIAESSPVDLHSETSTLNQTFSDWAQANSAETSENADWLTVCRRLSLGLVGSNMSLEEIRQLEKYPEADRIAIYTEYLLEDERWSDYFSERFARAFVGTDQGPFLLFRRRKFREWLGEQFEQEVPFDRIVQSLLTSEDLWTDKPEVNFITAQIPPGGNNRSADPIRLAGKTSRVFLGLRLDCLECHNDFLDKIYFPTDEEVIGGEQKHFHELAAFFAGTRLAENVFVGVREEKGEYLYKYLNASTESKVTPDVPFSKNLLPEKGKDRERLAAWITHPQNPAFSRAIVNRTWALMTGRPLLDPVDDIPLDKPTPMPLNWLADDFAKHKFDLKRLLRLISRSAAFQRNSLYTAGEVQPEQLKTWSVFPLTQLRPEQVAGSIVQASQLKTLDRDSLWLAQLARFGQMNDFLKAYGDRGEDELSIENETIPQRLLLLNGQMIRERTNPDPVANPIVRIANQTTNDTQCVEVCFLSVLNRRPNAEELQHFVQKIEGLKGQARTQAISDLAWVLMNTTEFLWNH